MSEQPQQGVAPYEKPSQEIVDRAKAESHQWLNPETWRTMQLVAQTFVQSGAMPKSMDTVPKVIVALQAGREAGMQPMEAINSFYFVNGKVSIYGEMAITQVIKAGHLVEWGECNAETATCTITRGDNGASNSVTFTMKMARDRGLTKNSVYQTAPENMLRFKAFHLCARFIVPDALHGVPVKEELEGSIIPEEATSVPEAEQEVQSLPTAKTATASQPVESLEDAVNKEPEEEKQEPEVEEMPPKEDKKKNGLPPEKPGEGKAAKAMRAAAAKNETEASEGNSKIPADVCQYVNMISEKDEWELSNDDLQLKLDTSKGEWKGYEAYRGLKTRIKEMKAKK